MKPQKCYSYIRFSSEKQSHGDSLRRQLQLSEEYAHKNNLVLDKNLSMKDLGLSAFKGDHIKKGALGKFLYLVDQGKIERGSILLVESLDRLSREKITDAIQQFLSIIKSGISIATLQDNQLYTPETIDNGMNQLIISISIMSRAYEESRSKQIRISASWEAKRQNAQLKKLTSKCPHWLILSKEKNEYQIIKERVKILERIFSLYLEGKGIETISRLFNKEGIPTWGRGKLWGRSYIWKMLRARTVLGEYQPKKNDENRKSVAAGEAVINYYPPVISEEIFYKVQSSLEQNIGKFGRTGNCSNLFSHIAKCGYCGSSMTYVNKGKSSSKSPTYLVCENARRGGDCTYYSFKYLEIEESFLQLCSQLRVKDIITDNKNETELQIISLNDEINVAIHKISESEGKINDLIELYGNTNKDVRVIVQKKIEDENIVLTTLNDTLKQKNDVLNSLKTRDKDTAIRLTDIQENIKILNGYKDDELFDVRKKIRTHIQDIVERIDVYPFGKNYNLPQQCMKYYPKHTFPEQQKVIDDIHKNNNKFIGKRHRSYVVIFKDGGTISIKANYETEIFERVCEVEDLKRIRFRNK